MEDTENIERLRKERASVLAEYGTIEKALESGRLKQFHDLSLSEAVVIGLYNQGVRKYIGIFGHGSTDLGEVLRIYEEEGVVEVYNVRNEVKTSHVATLLKWQYRETSAVFTSIGPGALQALSGSLTPLANGVGIYYIFGDETTHNEGPNFQQIPRREEDLFLKLTSVMGKSYSIHTPESIFTALKWGYVATRNKSREEPFFMLLPMNVQGKVMHNCNLLEFPGSLAIPAQISVDNNSFEKAVNLISCSEKITVKTGGGAKGVGTDLMIEFLELCDAVFVHSPTTVGIVPGKHERNMTVGGSKGSLSGNYAMENCELLIVVGARGVCQWDSSGTSLKKVRHIININTRLEDAMQYNRTLPLLGDAAIVIEKLVALLREKHINKSNINGTSLWLKSCMKKRKEWDDFKTSIFKREAIFDSKWKREILTQPAAIKTVVDFADSIKAVKLFDAGDVQANGFQIVEDSVQGMTYTDGGASYMGFSSSAILASSFSDNGKYAIAFTGDGSFMMNPQILLDASNYRLRGMIVIFDNRRMSAISALQYAQYGKEFKTDDTVVVDFVKLAESFSGVQGLFGGYTRKDLLVALRKGYEVNGLAVIHIPVYYGDDEAVGLGVYGQWNVGNWCADVQKEKHRLGF